ncbi:hypothetical protein NUACC21_32850 [Scytonema sp. NUACC21]
MGRFERRPDNLRGKGELYGAAEAAMRALTEELQFLQRNVLKSLQEDVKRLQVEKDRLTSDIQKLQNDKGQLQQEQQVTEQQALIRQLSQVLANHISVQLQSSLEALTNKAVQTGSQTGVNQQPTETTTPLNSNESNPNTPQLLDSLDDALISTFTSLQQELRNYQSQLSQQLSRMHNQQQQGEVILAELVNRLRGELQTATPNNPTVIQQPPFSDSTIPPQPQGYVEAPTKLLLEVSPQQETFSESPIPTSVNPTSETALSPPTPEPVTSASPPLIVESAPEQQATSRQTFFRQIGISSLPTVGILLIVLSTVASSLYNVAIKIIFNPGSQIFGAFEAQRLILPNLGSSLLILMLRMLVVVPLMMLLAPILHPRVWHDLQYLFDSVRRNSSHTTAKRAFILSVVSGCCLFLSQLLIYLAIGQVPTGMAIALFFVYPILSVLFSWVLFRDRLTLFSTGAIATIGVGELLVLGGAVSTGMGNPSLGSIAAVTSGIAFAFYIIFSRICATKVHPVTFTLINFATMLVLSFLGLLLPLPENWSLQINSASLLELILSAFILGVLTLCSYLLNNFGVRKIGASRSAIIGASVPAMTVIFGLLIIQETLQIEQVLGVLLVTCGAGTLSLEKLRNRLKPSKSL